MKERANESVKEEEVGRKKKSNQLNKHTNSRRRTNFKLARPERNTNRQTNNRSQQTTKEEEEKNKQCTTKAGARREEVK